MANNKVIRIGPVAISNVVANIVNPPATTGGVNCGTDPTYVIFRRIHVANKTGTAATFSMYIGATGGSAAGTELYLNQTVAANSSFDVYAPTRLGSTDFLTAVASAAATLTFQADAEIGIS